MAQFEDNQLTLFDNQQEISVAEIADDSCDLALVSPAPIITTTPATVEQKSELRKLLDEHSHRIWPADKTRQNSVSRVLRFDGFRDYSKLSLNDITALHIYDWLDHERTLCLTKEGDKGHPRYRSAASINRYASAISRILSFAAKARLRDSSPKLEYAKEYGRERFMKDSEIERLIQHFIDDGDHWMADLTFVGANTGMRLSEILSLGIVNCGRYYSTAGEATINNDSIYLPPQITKTGKGRYVSVNKQVRDACVRLSKSIGTHFTHRKFYRRWADARARIAPNDKEFVFHCLRHTCASRMANELSMNTIVIGKQLGHESTATTRKYVHNKPDELAKFTDQMTLGASLMNGGVA